MIQEDRHINEARKEAIIKEHISYIKYTAYKFSRNLPNYMPQADLVSAGLIGLMDAIERFTPGKCKFKTYAELRIKGSIIDELRSSDWLPRSQRKVIKDIDNACQRLANRLGRKPADAEVAKSMKLPMKKYNKMLKSRATASFLRMEYIVNDSHEKGPMDITEYIVDHNSISQLKILEDKEKRKKILDLIFDLPERDRLVLLLIYFKELTMKETGCILNVSESRVWQIHDQAIKNLRSKSSLLSGVAA